MTIHPALTPILADPVDNGALVLGSENTLVNPRTGVGYPVLDGVPALLAARGEPLPGPGPARGTAGGPRADGGGIRPDAAAAVLPIASFDGVADWYDAVMQDPKLHGPMTRVTNELFAARLGPGDGVVLDVACGTGLSPAWLAPLGYTVLGTDISADQLRLAKRRLPVVQADSAALPFLSDSVDHLVTSYSAATDLDGTAREAFRVLRRGGSYLQVNVHPVLNGSRSARQDDTTVVVSGDYHDYRTFSPDRHATTIRGRVGSVHIPLDTYLTVTAAAGFRLREVLEFGEYPEQLPTSILTHWVKD